MRQVVVLLGVAALIAWASPPATSQVAQAITILPGRAIGPFELGMSLERAREIMAGFGTVESYDGALGRGFCNPERGVGVCVFDRWTRLNLATPGAVAFVLTDDLRFATQPGGHKVGQTLLDMLKTFGLYTSAQETELLWDSRGLAVDLRIMQAGLVVQFIGVYSPRSLASR